MLAMTFFILSMAVAMVVYVIAESAFPPIEWARTKIVEGAVSMVEMALDELSKRKVVELDPERRAAMVSNLLVVLCGERGTQPIVNAGSIY